MSSDSIMTRNRSKVVPTFKPIIAAPQNHSFTSSFCDKSVCGHFTAKLDSVLLKLEALIASQAMMQAGMLALSERVDLLVVGNGELQKLDVKVDSVIDGNALIREQVNRLTDDHSVLSCTLVDLNAKVHEVSLSVALTKQRDLLVLPRDNVAGRRKLKSKYKSDSPLVVPTLGIGSEASTSGHPISTSMNDMVNDSEVISVTPLENVPIVANPEVQQLNTGDVSTVLSSTSLSSPLTAAIDRTWVYVSNLATHTTSDVIYNHLRNEFRIGSRGVKCTPLVKKKPSR